MTPTENSLAAIQGVSGGRVSPQGAELEAPRTAAHEGGAGQHGAEGTSNAGAQIHTIGSDALKALLEVPETKIAIEQDEHSGRMVMRLKDAETGEVIRQIPPEEVLKIAESIDRFLGLLVDKRR